MEIGLKYLKERKNSSNVFGIKSYISYKQNTRQKSKSLLLEKSVFNLRYYNRQS